ncbi:MAG TPA: AAA family ATPase [Lachnoclostridium phytofermentans]|uniref:AAA family ATPase n=1 Tax=Lachnoclostridium phytofermentans TaxID=66219 RepID=A0A3D2XB26_9FIRM|nr:ATP-binding protein [Lachnoclostridium sp.]HCL03735.1 AAA family ATPase [Lachnoclostridium phytofermentans]
MYKLLSKLVIYRNIGKDSILICLADIIEQYQRGNTKKEDTIAAIYTQIHNLLDIATEYGFNDNLWHNYLSYLLATVENPFSMSCEKVGAREGTVNKLAKGDFTIFKALFDYDFTPLEDELGIDCFKVITDYRAIEKNGKCYNHSVSEKVQELSRKISNAKDENEIFRIVTDFYKYYGVGMLGLNKAFRIGKGGDEFLLSPITNTEEVVLSDLIGYEIQKKNLVDNTKAFIEGKKANNVLLFGDSGTGKSTSVKAILNEFYPEGLRMVEIFKHQFEDLSTVISKIKNRNYKFIIYMDDLSFEEFEIEYKYLKAVIEGGLETKPDNVLIYATSNRRHLIRETWSDRSDMSKDELHRSDTIQEKLSLVARFGISINYSAPSQKEYFTIVEELAKKYNNFGLSKEDLIQKANMWELKGGGLSGRTASQFITYMLSQELTY